ncbi:MAG: DUF3047 domain-containing protein [Candidatus Omnitrophica bacterium]|nr:DUF3047 domain-containing protein [Candidatus Omnitrophota bacterium]
MRKIAFLIAVAILIAISVYFFKDKILSFVKGPKPVLVKIIKHFPFTKENSLKEWEEKVLKGKVVYALEQRDPNSYVRASSDNTASALYYKIKLDISNNPVIEWKWRVDEFPKRKFPETLSGKKEEDFAARVYIMFPAAFFTGSKVVEYIWSETIPEGTHGTSGYSKNIKLLVLEKGSSDGEWRFEKRNIYEDYLKLFGKRPKLNIGAIAFMTDADSTKTSASATYDEIKIGYEKKEDAK